MDNRLNKFDDYFIELINNRLKNPLFDSIMPKITNLGGVVFTSFIIFIFLILTSFNIEDYGFELLVAIIISQSIVYSLKAILARERPYNILDRLNTYGFELRDYSFPSGHSSSSFLISTILSYYFPEYRILLYTLSTLISISRIYLAVHYPTDVLGGTIIGIISGIFVHHFLMDKIISIVLSFSI